MVVLIGNKCNKLHNLYDYTNNNELCANEHKADILSCHYLEDIFHHNELQEINFLQKGTSSNKKFTDAEDNALRDNQKSEYDILIRTLIDIEEKFKEQGDEDSYKNVKTLAKEIVNFMGMPSKVLLLGGQSRLREITRGLFNNELYKICVSKVECQILEQIWEQCYLNIRTGIWLV
ncbi:hypothetical protein C1646_753772 [Rhizophagus diaphanus]|nr:hypothetical protein C1646_753772 [Rhizophagus diaphanus] [Rhizophagus sp. MUCL 43196]